uniref:F-box/kelch-repeat protein At3g06240-like isoform X1 n=1 Tax=Erigeron canadensis TaxID=72917 RepID=UPI001CB8E754|nr:F-box/kelch-repeat protein At3g06240-like isoform X1 [Erigeron canadensis]
MVSFNRFFIIGSANGLVCICPKDFELLVVNPCTRQTMKILEPPPEPLPKSTHRWDLIWGFGYDSSNNDYKIVLGLETKMSTRFYVFSLKTCLWKFVQEIELIDTNWNRVSGLLCDGALHWFMLNLQSKENIILSLNLSREEFTVTQQPDPDNHPSYEYGCSYTLGVLEECLCIYELDAVLPPTPTKIWVLRSYKSGKQSWVELPLNHVMNHGVAYHMNKDDYSYDDTPHLSISGEYLGAPIFVPSLISPHNVKMDSSSKSGSNCDICHQNCGRESGWHGKEECTNKLIKGRSPRL